MNHENKIHRRQILGGLGATFAAVAVTPAFASPFQLADNSGSYATGQIYGSSGGKGQP